VAPVGSAKDDPPVANDEAQVADDDTEDDASNGEDVGKLLLAAEVRSHIALNGRVFAADGRPAEGIIVMATDATGHLSGTQSERDGAFALSGLAGGRIAVWFWSGAGTKLAAGDVAISEHAPAYLEIHVPRDDDDHLAPEGEPSPYVTSYEVGHIADPVFDGPARSGMKSSLPSPLDPDGIYTVTPGDVIDVTTRAGYTDETVSFSGPSSLEDTYIVDGTATLE
jgi:hypothetical protein